MLLIMDKERILSVFLPVKKQFTNFISRYECSLIHIEFGFESNYFNTNIGNDFIAIILNKCCANNFHEFLKDSYKGTSDINFYHTEEHTYNYGMTPFDLRYRFVTLKDVTDKNDHDKTKQIDNRKFILLQENDCFINFSYDTIMYFNKNNGRFGLICDIENAKNIFFKNWNEKLSIFFIFDRCCLMVRDIVEMVDGFVCDSDTFIQNFRCT